MLITIPRTALRAVNGWRFAPSTDGASRRQRTALRAVAPHIPTSDRTLHPTDKKLRIYCSFAPGLQSFALRFRGFGAGVSRIWAWGTRFCSWGSRFFGWGTRFWRWGSRFRGWGSQFRRWGSQFWGWGSHFSGWGLRFCAETLTPRPPK